MHCQVEIRKCAERRAYPVQDLFEMYSKDYRGGVPCGRTFAFVARRAAAEQGVPCSRREVETSGSDLLQTDKASKGRQSIANGQA